MRQFDPQPAPHIPAPSSVRRMMLQVLVALIPGIAAHVWFFGPAIAIQLILACGFALGFEALCLKARGRPLLPYLNDLSAPLTAVLYVLCLPPLMPWYTTAIGLLFAIVVAKHLYGGLGHNLFNPAMVGYAVILVAFPLHATSWLPPASLAENPIGLMSALEAIFTGGLPAPLSFDAITEATPLDHWQNGISSGQMMSEIRQSPVFGDYGGVGWEWIANGYLLGGLYLMARRIISWRVPVALLGSVVILTLPGSLIDPDTNPLVMEHLFTGGIMLAAFFIATDPVSGSTTPRGMLIFGAGVAILTLIIRRWGAYPEGIAFAVLMMNMAVPLIDRHTRTRVFGT